MSSFHFLRPWFLLTLIPLGLLVYLIYRHQDRIQTWREIIAPNLLPHLLTGSSAASRFAPLHLLAMGWLIAVLSIAGPTWRREPSPFADDTAALAIVVKVTPSMKTEDIQPDRLTRAVQKIHDLLAARRGAKAALIAYAGTAHIVMPLTTDEGIINTFAQALDPKIMPMDGDAAAAALSLADTAIAKDGSILWITDSIASEQSGPLAQWRQNSSTPVHLLPPLLAGSELEALVNSAREINARVVQLSADDSDISALARAAKFSTAAGGETSNQWEESGYWLTPALTALMLPFFRKGWMTRTAAKA